MVATRGDDRGGGEGPAQLLGRAGRPPPARAAPGGRTRGRPRRDRRCRTSRTRAAGWPTGDAEWPAAHRHRAGVRQRSQARARRTRVAGVCTRTGPRPARRRSAHRDLLGHPGRPGERVALELERRWRRRRDTVTARAERLAGRDELVGPAGARAAARPRRCGRSRRPAPPRPRPGRAVSSTSRAWGYGARGSAWRSSPSSQIATSPRSCDRGERRGPGADHDPAGPARDGQELAVAPRRPGSGGEHDVVAGAEHVGQGGVDPGEVAVVGDARARCRGPPASVAAAACGEQPRPVVAGQRRPDRTRRAAAGEVGEERVGRGLCADQAAAAARRRPATGSSGGDVLLLRGRVPGRDGEPERRRRGCRRSARRGRRPARRPPGAAPARGSPPGAAASACRCARCAGPRDDEAVEVLAGEPHLDPRARDRARRPSTPGRRSRRGGRGGPAASRPAPGPPGRRRRPARPGGARRGRPARGADRRPEAREGLGRGGVRGRSWPQFYQRPPTGDRRRSPRSVHRGAVAAEKVEAWP